MKLNLLVASSDQMIDNVRRRGIASRTTKPLATGKTSDNCAWSVDAAISILDSANNPWHHLEDSQELTAHLLTRKHELAALFPLQHLALLCLSFR